MSMTTSCHDTVTAGRARIDGLDAGIIRLLRERQRVSAAVQQARLDVGEPRLHHDRELSILQRYRDELGKPGTAVAMAVLDACRGRGVLPGPPEPRA
jgi:chorismate mutase